MSRCSSCSLTSPSLTTDRCGINFLFCLLSNNHHSFFVIIKWHCCLYVCPPKHEKSISINFSIRPKIIFYITSLITPNKYVPSRSSRSARRCFLLQLGHIAVFLHRGHHFPQVWWIRAAMSCTPPPGLNNPGTFVSLKEKKKRKDQIFVTFII